MEFILMKKILFAALNSLTVCTQALALRLPGEIQPTRYTYYLTSEYGQKLKALNDSNSRSYINVPYGELMGDTPIPKAKGLPAPTAMTCISSIYYNRGAAENWLKVACVDNQGLEYSANQKWPPKTVAKRICTVGQSGCETFIVLGSERWSGPQ
ncbi:hypothetical protein H0A34_05810 [Providencia rettgeri]|nr:hypothetical protein H0A34_05810 [Providencia rettgeri]